jgi:uncharacterized delta-60 repeat protein
MALPTSGALTAAMINEEIGRSSTAVMNLNGLEERKLAASLALSLSGSVDNDFNVGTGASSSVYTASIQSDGKVIIGGAFTSYSGTTTNRIARLHSNGVLDTTFDVGTGLDGAAASIIIQNDGKIIAGGLFYFYQDVAQNRLTRIHSNGIRDSSFDIGTGFNSTIGNVGTVDSVLLQPNGRIIVGGSFSRFSGTIRNGIVRLFANGNRDDSFNVGTGFTNFGVSSLSRQPDDKVIAGGIFTRYQGTDRNRICRIHSNGILDTDFSVGIGASSTVETTSIQSDGKVIIGGQFTSYSNSTVNRIARLYANGFLDTTFSVGTGFNDRVNTTSIQSDGKVIIGGWFTGYSGEERNRIVRLHTNGVLDTTFDVGTGGNSTVSTISIQSDGKIIIGGDFTSYSGAERNRITRVNTELYKDPQKLAFDTIISFDDFYGKKYTP